MANFFRGFIALLVASLTTAIIGSVFSSQFVISELISIGAEIPFSTRLSMTADDFGILPSLMPLTLICFVIAFSIASLCNKYIGGKRIVWYIIAGSAGLMATLLVMKAVLVVTGIAGTRSTLGFLSFGLAGAVGGWVFAKLTNSLAKPGDR